MKRKVLSIMLTGVMLVTLLAGCGASNKGTESSSSTAETTEATKEEQAKTETEVSKDVVELTMWDASWNEGVTEKLLEQFHVENPNIKVNVEFFPDNGMSDRYLTAIMAGSGADLLSVNNEWISTYATAGGLLNLDEYIAANNIDVTDFYPGAVNGITVQNSIYGMPYRAETHGMYYNEDMLSAAGTDQMPETWEEFVPILEAATTGGVSGIAIPGGQVGNTSYQLINMIMCNGGSILTEDNSASNFDAPEVIEAAKFFVELHTVYGVTPSSILENDNAAGRSLFENESTAAFMSGPFDIDTIREANPEMNFNTAKLPAFAGKERRVIFAGWSTAIASHTKYPEEAFKVAQFLASPEVSVEYSSTFSARVAMMEHEKYQSDPLRTNLGEMLPYGAVLPVIPQLTQIRQILFEEIQLAIAGDVTPEEAMAVVHEKVNAIL